MPRFTRRTVRTAAALAAAALAAPLAGCYSASGAQLGSARNQTIDNGLGYGDALGAAMFQQHTQIATADARQRFESGSGFATVNVPVD